MHRTEELDSFNSCRYMRTTTRRPVSRKLFAVFTTLKAAIYRKSKRFPAVTFPQSVKTEALARAKRCCCICHQFAGRYVNVHHILPVSEGGQDTIDNAIVLCLRCHGEVGHFNVAHPIGNKYTRQEIVRHRDEWYKLCEGNRLPMFAGYPAGQSPQKLIDDGRWPALRALFMMEIEQVRQSLGQEEFQWSPQNSKELWDVIEAYETACGGLIALFMILCQNDHPQCVQLAAEGLEKIANVPKATQEPKLHLYPGLLALYSGGMASVLGQTYKTLKALLYDVNIRNEHNEQAALALTAWTVVDRKFQALLRSRYQKRFVLSYRLSEVLRDSARQYLFVEGDMYEEYFDKFEYFHNLAYSDLCGPFDSKLPQLWPPLGYFVIRRYQHTDFLDGIEQDYLRDHGDWPPLRAGFFNGDFSRLVVLGSHLRERIELFGNSKYSHNYP